MRSSVKKLPVGTGDLSWWLRALACSFRGGLRFGSQHSQSSSHFFVISVPWAPDTHVMNLYRFRPNTKKIKMFKIFK